MKNLLVVAAALIDAEGRVLLAQRPVHKSLPGKWEFPGGKIEEGEAPEAALVRELTEELGITVRERDIEPFWFLSHSYPKFEFHLMMPVWLCRKWQGEPKALEHAAVQWVHPRNMHGVDMIEADKPLVERLLKVVSHAG